MTVLRYVERNPVRAALARAAQDWRWSSAAPPQPGLPEVTPSPVPRPADWLRWVNEPQTEAALGRPDPRIPRCPIFRRVLSGPVAFV